jgi:hypothetical protein
MKMVHYYMVDYGRIIAYLTLVCLILVFGYAYYLNTPQPDPFVGDWLYTFPGGGYTHISINASGEFDERSASNIVGPSGRRIGLAPVHGTWKKQETSTYRLNSSGNGIEILVYSPSEDVIYDKDGHGFSRFNASVK